VDRAQREALHRDVSRLADGDRDAFHPVFVRLWPLLRGFVGRHLPPADAEDAAQDALVRVFARAAEFDPRRDALSWALGIAAYEIKTARRRRQRRRESGEAISFPEIEDPQAGPEAMAIERERQASVEAAFAALDAADADTLRAYLADARPDVKAPTFRKRVQRALARLRAAWRTSHGRP
jgi:RNA polymerase sigma factor (sigma-70 family)